MRYGGERRERDRAEEGGTFVMPLQEMERRRVEVTENREQEREGKKERRVEGKRGEGERE